MNAARCPDCDQLHKAIAYEASRKDGLYWMRCPITARVHFYARSQLVRLP